MYVEDVAVVPFSHGVNTPAMAVRRQVDVEDVTRAIRQNFLKRRFWANCAGLPVRRAVIASNSTVQLVYRAFYASF